MFKYDKNNNIPFSYGQYAVIVILFSKVNTMDGYSQKFGIELLNRICFHIYITGLFYLI